MQKEVLFINHCLTGGGSEKAMTLIANYFVKQGINTSMVLLNKQKRTYMVDERIHIIECYCPIQGNKWIWHLKRIKTIRDVLKKSKAKIVITFMWDINMNVILANWGLKKKIIASERCDPRHETRKLIKFAMNFILPFADFSVFQTEQVRNYYPKRVQKKSCVIPNALADDLPPPNRSTIEKTIVAIGRMTEQKNFEMLINVFSDFLRKFSEYYLIIYGDGPLRTKLQKQAQDLGIENKVFFPGYVSNINYRIKNASMYINSSNYEGISNAMLEAMAMGVPSVCTDCPVGGASMTISNEINGLLVPVNNANALLDAMCKIASSSKLSKKLSMASIQIRKTLNINAIGNDWLQIYKTMEEKNEYF